MPNVENGPQTARYFLAKLLHNHILVLHHKVDWFLSHYLYTIIPTDIAPSPKEEPSSKHLLGEAPLVLNHGSNPSWEIPPIRHTSTALSESMGVLISENVLAEPGAFFIACVAKKIRLAIVFKSKDHNFWKHGS